MLDRAEHLVSHAARECLRRFKPVIVVMVERSFFRKRGVSVDAVSIEGNPVRTEIAVLDDVAAKADARGQFDCRAVALAGVIISGSFEF
jgi:hypothetical protein